MEILTTIAMIIIAWMMTSALFMLGYKSYGDETLIERIALGIICFPWLVCFVISGLISAFIDICEKKIKENKK